MHVCMHAGRVFQSHHHQERANAYYQMVLNVYQRWFDQERAPPPISQLLAAAGKDGSGQGEGEGEGAAKSGKRARTCTHYVWST